MNKTDTVSTLALVAPEAREIVPSFPRLVPDPMAPGEFRALLLSFYPEEHVDRTEYLISSPAGRPDVRVLVYRPEGTVGPLPAILYAHGGGVVAGQPDLMDGARSQLADRLGVVVVSVQYRPAREH